MRILISGAGIAGPTLAYWLKQYGFTPTLVERAPKLRTGGYIIDFWGAGFDIAERMGLVPELRDQGYAVKEVRVVDRNGKRISGFPVDVINHIAQGRYVSIGRSALAELIYRKLDGEVGTLFGDSISGIEQGEDEVQVRFESGSPRTFDLVIGADGLHSRVRELVFGPEERFEKYLGYKAAAFEAESYRPRDELAYIMFTEVGQQVSRFTMRGDRTLFLFIFADPDPQIPSGLEAQKALLRERFGGSGWECPGILKALDACEDLYYDRVSQIRMDPADGLWSKGRVSLVGDAASCVSFLAGQGTALAMTAAYILAGELHRSGGDHRVAFEEYQRLFGPFVARKQEAALRFGGAFAPRSAAGLAFRNWIFKIMSMAWVTSLVAERDLVDRIALPDYGAPAGPC